MNLDFIKGLTYVLMFVVIIEGVTAQEVPEISQGELQECTVTRNQTFDGGSLWGYMNGGADIYLEYGFEILRVEEFAFEEEEIKLELFKMDDPVSAFGIYSIKTFKCAQTDVFNKLDCLNKYQFQMACGDYYFQLISSSGSETSQKYMLEIADILIPKLGKDELRLPCRYLSDSLNVPVTDLKMVKGYLGIQNKLIELAGLFDNIEDYQIYYTSVEAGEETHKYYEVVLSDPEMLGLLKSNIELSSFKIYFSTIDQDFDKVNKLGGLCNMLFGY